MWIRQMNVMYSALFSIIWLGQKIMRNQIHFGRFSTEEIMCGDILSGEAMYRRDFVRGDFVPERLWAVIIWLGQTVMGNQRHFGRFCTGEILYRRCCGRNRQTLPNGHGKSKTLSEILYRGDFVPCTHANCHSLCCVKKDTEGFI